MLVGGYGLYDLLMAPETYVSQHSGLHANGRPRRSSGGLIGKVVHGGKVELCPGKETVNVLVLGTDERRSGGRADTIMLVMLHKQSKRVAAISVPRDLKVHYGKHGSIKINAVYAYNRDDNGSGERATAATVARILSTGIDYYIKTNVTRLPRLFDAFGGLDLYVDRNMNWDDGAGELHIHLRKGQQHLDGGQIEGFVRHRRDRRGPDSLDQHRTRRQRYVLQQLVLQKANMATAARLPEVIRTIRDMVRTDMTTPELVALGLLAKESDLHNVISRSLPAKDAVARARGAPSYAYWDAQGTRKMMAEVRSMLREPYAAPEGDDASAGDREPHGGDD